MSGSEFALRIALCDVVEKWKRSQEKCKYLEQCRNELANELIRVKQHNEDLVKENSALAASLESSTSMDKHMPNRPDVALTGPLRRVKGSGSPLVPTRPDDEDWEQISQRLLNELRKEVTQARLKSFQSVQPQEDAVICNKNIILDDDAGVVGNNSVGSELVVGNQPSSPEQLKWSKHPDGTERQAKPAAATAVRHASHGCGDQQIDQEMGDEEEDRVTKNVLSCGQEETIVELEPPVVVSGSHDEKAISQVYVKILAGLTADLNKATQRIIAQNEKLAKMKSKQLRSYFRRQLRGEDHSSNSTGNSSNIPNPAVSRCHFEHV